MWVQRAGGRRMAATSSATPATTMAAPITNHSGRPFMADDPGSRFRPWSANVPPARISRRPRIVRGQFILLSGGIHLFHGGTQFALD